MQLYCENCEKIRQIKTVFAMMIVSFAIYKHARKVL